MADLSNIFDKDEERENPWNEYHRIRRNTEFLSWGGFIVGGIIGAYIVALKPKASFAQMSIVGIASAFGTAMTIKLIGNQIARTEARELINEI